MRLRQTTDFALGYSLLQQGDDGLMCPIAFEGRKLKPTEMRYPTHEKELLAIKEAINKWKHYIQNKHTTTVLTDHESLRYMNTVSKPSNRLIRWIDEFQGYDLDIRYLKGRDAIIPDALSRRPDYRREYQLNFILELDKYLNSIYDHEEFISHLKDFLTDHGLPRDPAIRERITRGLNGDPIAWIDRSQSEKQSIHPFTIRSKLNGLLLNNNPISIDRSTGSRVRTNL